MKYFNVKSLITNFLFLFSFFLNSSKPLAELINDKTLFRELPRGPLDRYRKIASFDWRKLALLLEPEKCIRFRVSV